jgi:hypothetical protein
MDELWSFVDDKGNEQWVWLAIDVETREMGGATSVTVQVNQPKPFGNPYQPFTVSVQSVTAISGCLIQWRYQANVIEP